MDMINQNKTQIHEIKRGGSQPPPGIRALLCYNEDDHFKSPQQL